MVTIAGALAIAKTARGEVAAAAFISGVRSPEIMHQSATLANGHDFLERRYQLHGWPMSFRDSYSLADRRYVVQFFIISSCTARAISVVRDDRQL